MKTSPVDVSSWPSNDVSAPTRNTCPPALSSMGALSRSMVVRISGPLMVARMAGCDVNMCPPRSRRALATRRKRPMTSL